MTKKDLSRIEKEAEALYPETEYDTDMDEVATTHCRIGYIAGATAENERLSEFREFMWGISTLNRVGTLNYSEAVKRIIEKWDRITANDLK